MEQRRSGIGEVWPRGSGIPKRRYGTKAYQKGGMEQGSSGIGGPAPEVRHRRSGTGGPAQTVPQKGKSYTEEV